ncbi:ester cyclase [Streptomyces sp. bgisy027]|uniref:ester cyclase n=1 Tax=unclassified Streptomyces TaxID=2593676 RepID=UPI003D712DAF
MSAGKIWSVEDNLRQMQVSDDAYNARDIARFNHRDDARMHMPGGVEMDMDAHVNDILAGLAAFPDLRPHNHDYKIAFGEGEWTFAVADVTATNTGPVMGPSGKFVPPTGKPVAFEMATAARWIEGRILEEYVWTDTPRMLRQLGLLPSPLPAEPTVGLALGSAIPLTARPGTDAVAENKARMKDSDDAWNAGELNAESLHFAPDILVYGLDEKPLGLDEYLGYVGLYRAAFPDLAIGNDPYVHIIGSGDWTVTIARSAGTHTGPLPLPDWVAPEPLPATGKRVDVPQYTAARWQDGKITHLKVMSDLFALAGQLGLGS